MELKEQEVKKLEVRRAEHTICSCVRNVYGFQWHGFMRTAGMPNTHAQGMYTNRCIFYRLCMRVCVRACVCACMRVCVCVCSLACTRLLACPAPVPQSSLGEEQRSRELLDLRLQLAGGKVEEREKRIAQLEADLQWMKVREAGTGGRASGRIGSILSTLVN